MSLKDFISASRLLGIAKPNRFSVYFQAPDTLANAGPFTPYACQNIALFCNRAELPAITLSTTPIRLTGEVLNMPYDRNFGDCTMSFYADTGMNAKYFFEEWINSIQDRDDRTFAYYDDYTIPKMVIDVETIQNEPSYRVELFDVFPKAVNSVNLDYAANGLMEITVSFEYRSWKSKQLVGGVETAWSRDSFGFNNRDPFINLQGGLSLALGRGFQGFATGGLQSSLGNAVLGGIVGTVKTSFNSLANSISGLTNIIPSEMFDAGNASLISSMSSEALNYAGVTNNMGIQLSTPGGMNISQSEMTSIGGKLQALSGAIGPSGPVNSLVQAFVPSSVGAITTQLTNMGSSLAGVGSQLADASASVNLGILNSTNAKAGVALNGPRG